MGSKTHHAHLFTGEHAGVNSMDYAELKCAEEACRLMYREVSETLATSTTTRVELGWLGRITTMRNPPALMQCTRCKRVLLSSRAAGHLQACGQQGNQNPNQNQNTAAAGLARRAVAGTSSPAAGASKPPPPAAIRKPPLAPAPARPKAPAAEAELPSTKLNKVTYDVQPGISMVDDMLSGHSDSLSFSMRKPRTARSRR